MRGSWKRRSEGGMWRWMVQSKESPSVFTSCWCEIGHTTSILICPPSHSNISWKHRGLFMDGHPGPSTTHDPLPRIHPSLHTLVSTSIAPHHAQQSWLQGRSDALTIVSISNDNPQVNTDEVYNRPIRRCELTRCKTRCAFPGDARARRALVCCVRAVEGIRTPPVRGAARSDPDHVRCPSAGTSGEAPRSRFG